MLKKITSFTLKSVLAFSVTIILVSFGQLGQLMASKTHLEMSVIENWITSHPADIVLVAEYRENCLNHGKQVTRDNLEQSLAAAKLEDFLVTKERCAKSMGLEELHNNIEVAVQQIESYAWPLSLLDDSLTN
ncbi:hypothetical protein AB4562_10165 [Vibrio sp. 10N.222.54.A1]|uniref:Uncharacterized protein n=3 Tax=Vibrio TaxID=662 RepID=A0A7Z1MLK8_9VIBR|nr:hypothetical protein [Vibrio cyclitrophicus]PMP21830.1 hypothetical protein BCS91_18815 [Vibrio cyclitrophicus]PMP31616.1 hypothetical protein BCS90_11530 [Vibrio cyclitrophicus]